MSSRFSGLRASGRILPRTKNTISAGTRVMANKAANAIENVLASASGRNSRPSSPSSVNTGRKATVSTSSAPKIDGPSSRAAANTSSSRGVLPSGSAAIFLCAFSVSTTAESTMSPSARMRPASDMMLMVMSSAQKAMKVARVATGSAMAATSDERRWNRNTAMTSTMMARICTTLVPRVCTDARISPLRSYTGTICTPGGSEALRSASLCLTRSMTARAFSPERMTTMPPTTSPRPSRSAMPRRRLGPTCTVATSAVIV